MIRVLSVQRVRPRGAAEFTSVYVQFEDEDTVSGCWRVHDDLVALDAKLTAAGCAPVRAPPLTRMLVDAGARAAVDKELARVLQIATKDDKVRSALGRFLGVRDLPVAKARPPVVSPDKARAFYVARMHARAIVKALLALQKVRQAVGASAGILALTALVAVWAQYKQLRSALFGALAGLMSSTLAYELSLRQAGKAAQQEAQVAATAIGKGEEPIEATDENADMKVLRKAMEAEYEAKYAPRDEEEVTEEDLEAARAIEEALVVELDALDAKHEHTQAWERVQGYLEKPQREQTLAVLWRAARAGYYTASIMKTELGETDPARLATLKRALDIVEDLLERFPDASATHKYYAIIAQDWTNHQGTKEKIIGGFTFEKHTLRAIELNPNDPTLQYMYGMFCFEVAKLSWAERVGAKAVFGREPPKTTFAQALQHFQKAHALRSPDLAALFETARCYQKLGKKAEARAALKELRSYPEDASNPEWTAVMNAADEFEASL
ncbi:Regulator of microtubule dynamics protein 1 [Hondaea fermentalgiana]|uniref:Regulator of microtubule dynamics protein 1 n=1 Tax=Hondaea fermentalgiana TaxID=2315210 RepID=A0A2R5G6Y9_9STRA|nr:Regulator of microtubule dynamics protein 1 [Hondaea fermentalgiana]|eukprot:GBG26822.1 Regulator of microtubule dynamics protein 1 [Hondaea fermentalgiana]